MRIDGVSFHRAAGEQGRKKASKAENEWLMSSVGRGKKKKRWGECVIPYIMNLQIGIHPV